MANAKDKVLTGQTGTSGVSVGGQFAASKASGGGVLGTGTGTGSGGKLNVAVKGAGSANAAESRMKPHPDPSTAPKVTASSLPKVVYTGNKNETYVDPDNALAEFYKWTDKQRKQWGDYAVSVGLISAEDNNFDGQLAVWKRVVQEGQQFTAVGKKYTPKQIAGLLGTQGVTLSAPGAAPPAPKFSGVKSVPGETFDITNPTQAKENITAIFQAYLGRDPAPGELSTFAETLKKAEQANPVKSVSDTTYVNDEPTATKVTRTGGVDGNQILADSAKALPEHGAYQAAVTYANKLFEAIASPV